MLPASPTSGEISVFYAIFLLRKKIALPQVTVKALEDFQLHWSLHSSSAFLFWKRSGSGVPLWGSPLVSSYLLKGIEVSIKMCIYTWWTHQKPGGLFIMHGHINYHSAVSDFTASYIWTVTSMRFSPILLWRISFEFRCKSDRLKFLTSRSF